MLEKLFIQLGRFPLFQSDCANSLYSKINISCEVVTKISEAVGPGSSFCCAKYFYDLTDIFQKFQWFP